MDSQDLQETNSGKASKRAKASSASVPAKQATDTVEALLSVSVTSKAFNVYAVKKGTQDVASFALTNTGASSTGGVTFVFPSTFSGNVTVTFVLGTGIARLESSTLAFGPVVNGQQNLTLTAPSTVSANASGYSFTVIFTSGGTHDPQIVVSPIGGQPGNQAGAKKSKASGKRASKAPAKAKAKAPAKTKAKAKAPAKAKRSGPARKNKR